MRIAIVLCALTACTAERDPHVTTTPTTPAPAMSDASPPPDAGSWLARADFAAKVPNREALKSALERAGAAGTVSLYVRLDPKTAPPTADERKQALATAGVGPQTIAGDVATVNVPSAKIDALLALPWVVSVEIPSTPKPR